MINSEGALSAAMQLELTKIINDTLKLDKEGLLRNS